MRFSYRSAVVVALAITALLITPLTPRTAHATMAQRLSMAELVEQADHIATVTVLDATPRYDARGRIVTDMRLRVDEALHGCVAGDELMMVTFGGVIGDLGMRISGEPSFSAGERFLLFGRAWEGLVRPVGMSQGTLPIRDPGTNQIPLVGPGGQGLTFPDEDHGAHDESHSAEAPRALDGVLQEVRQLLRQ